MNKQSYPQYGSHDQVPSYDEAMGNGSTKDNKSNLEKYKQLILKHEISSYYATKIRQLENFEIVFICDDSGSMRSKVKPNSPYEQASTRWEELKDTVKKVMELAVLMDPDGLDIYFMNREPLLGATDTNTIEAMFLNEPSGYTPLIPAIERVLADKKQVMVERKLLIIIATDGVSTDQYGKENSDQVEKLLRAMEKNYVKLGVKTFISFLACTDDDNVMKILDKWDRTIKGIDTVDDYESEKKQILEVNGSGFKFSRGDYMVKALIGAIDPELDNMDEPKKCTIM